MAWGDNWARIRIIEQGLPATRYPQRREPRLDRPPVAPERLRRTQDRVHRQRLIRASRPSGSRLAVSLFCGLLVLGAPWLMSIGPVGLLVGGLLLIVAVVGLVDCLVWWRRRRQAQALLRALTSGWRTSQNPPMTTDQ